MAAYHRKWNLISGVCRRFYIKISMACVNTFILRCGLSLEDGISSRPVAVILIRACLLSFLFFSPVFAGEESAPSSDISVHTYANTAMGGIVRLMMEGTNSQWCDQVAREVFASIDKWEKDLDHRSLSGSVGRVNGSAGKKEVGVSPFAWGIIQRAVSLGKQTQGIFDITIGAITLEPFYYGKKISEKVKDLVDYKKLHLEPSSRKVFLPKAGMAIDLGGLAKGSIVDAAAWVIRQNWIPRALVEAGGDLYCYGNKQWRVGIQNPRADELLGVIEVSNAAVCGSGDYYQYQETSEEQTQRKHHILDPACLASAHKSIAITVVAPTAELADALATALFIAGPKKGLDLVKTFADCSALWVLPDGSLVASPGFPKFL